MTLKEIEQEIREFLDAEIDPGDDVIERWADAILAIVKEQAVDKPE